jgi:hypothetical protein
MRAPAPPPRLRRANFPIDVQSFCGAIGGERLTEHAATPRRSAHADPCIREIRRRDSSSPAATSDSLDTPERSWDRALRRRCRAAQDRSHRRPPSAPYIITMAPSPLPPLPPNHDASGRPAMRQDHHVGALHRAEQLHAGPPDHADVVTLLPRSTSATPASGALPARLSIR